MSNSHDQQDAAERAQEADVALLDSIDGLLAVFDVDYDVVLV